MGDDLYLEANFKVKCDFILTFQDWRHNKLGGIDTDIMRAANKYEKLGLARKPSWQALDPATVALFLKPDLVEEYKFSKHDIIDTGKLIEY